MPQTRLPGDLKVLLVEDDGAVRRILRSGLRNLGFDRVTEATGAVEGLKLAKEQPFDVVLSDMDMQPLSGIDLAHTLRNPKEARDPKVPIVLVGGAAEDTREAHQAGADAFHAKPVSPQALAETIQRALSNRDISLDLRSEQQRRADTIPAVTRTRPKPSADNRPPPPQVLASVRLAVADRSAELRRDVVGRLKALGFKRIVETAKLGELEQMVRHNAVDLVICEDSFDDGSAGDLVRRLRHHEVGQNPFLVVIMVLARPSQEAVRQAIDSGADDLLLKPLDVKKLIGRIALLTRTRKDFVVTTDYVGPDRRAKERPGTERVPKIPVPNPLQPDSGGPLKGGMQAEIDRVAKIINEQKLERHAFQLDWLVRRLIRAEQEQLTASDVTGHVERLAYVAEDTARRVRGSRYAHAGQLREHRLHALAQLRFDGPREGDRVILAPAEEQALVLGQPKVVDHELAVGAGNVLGQHLRRTISQWLRCGDEGIERHGPGRHPPVQVRKVAVPSQQNMIGRDPARARAHLDRAAILDMQHLRAFVDHRAGLFGAPRQPQGIAQWVDVARAAVDHAATVARRFHDALERLCAQRLDRVVAMDPGQVLGLVVKRGGLGHGIGAMGHAGLEGRVGGMRVRQVTQQLFCLFGHAPEGLGRPLANPRVQPAHVLVEPGPDLPAVAPRGAPARRTRHRWQPPKRGSCPAIPASSWARPSPGWRW